MAQVLIDETNLTNIANAIREKNSSTDYYAVTEMADAIRQIVGGSDGLPIGVMLPYGNEAAPSNWLVCDGRAVSRTYYAELFAVIGTRYGAGDGSTTFNLPNKKGRASVGLDTGDSSFNAIGKKAGAKTHTLSENEIPGHRHIGDTWAAGGHDHSAAGWANWLSLGGEQNILDAGSEGAIRTSWVGDHSHHFETSYTGGGQAHNNLQPYEVDNWIIKAFAIEDNSEVVLYNNSAGSNGTISLSDNVVNYNSIKIFYYYNHWYGKITGSREIDISISNLTNIGAELQYYDTGNLYFSNKLISINGTTINTIQQCGGAIGPGSIANNDNTLMYITKVVGYPKVVSVYNNGDEVSY